MKFLLLIICLIHPADDQILISPTKQQIDSLSFGFLHSHQLRSPTNVLETLKPYINDACISSPSFSYMAKNYINSTELSVQLTAATMLYYIEYQKYLLNSIRHPYNPFVKFKSWRLRNQSKDQLKSALTKMHAEKKLNHLITDEFTLNTEIIHRIVKELINLERQQGYI